MVPRYHADRKHWRPIALAAILLASVLLPAPTLAAGSSGSATVSEPPVQAENTPHFHQQQFSEHRGDVATIRIDLGNATDALVRVDAAGENASPYSAEVVVRDRDDDGRVDVRLDTYSLGTDADAITATGPDAVEIRRATALDARLRAGNYSLELEHANESVDRSTLVVRPAGVDALQVWTALGSRPANVSTADALEEAMANGTFARDANLSIRDTLLLELHAPGLSGPLAAQPGSNTTAQFLNLLETTGVSLTIHENESTVGLHAEPIAFSLTPGATTVVAIPEADTYYVLAPLGRLPRQTVDDVDGDTRFEIGDILDVNVTLTSESGVVETQQTAESQLEMIGWATADTPIDVTPDTNQTITARSSFVENRNVTVVLETEDRSFSANQSIEVDRDGEIVATFDLSNLTPGTTLTLTIVGEHEGRVYLSKRGGVQVRSRTPSPTPTSTPTLTATTPTRTDRPAESSTPDGTATTAPGFQIGLTLLVAGLLAAAIALRRG